MSVTFSAVRNLWAAAADLANPLGPDGAPSSVEEYQDASGKYGYQWVNYDSSYNTQYSYDDGGTVVGTLAAGVTSIFTIQQKPLFAVRHASGKLYSAWTPVGGGAE